MLDERSADGRVRVGKHSTHVTACVTVYNIKVPIKEVTMETSNQSKPLSYYYELLEKKLKEHKEKQQIRPL